MIFIDYDLPVLFSNLVLIVTLTSFLLTFFIRHLIQWPTVSFFG